LVQPRGDRDGWFRTGDVGHLDDEGDLWIEARKDDLIRSGGERICPAELEDLLRRAPEVGDVASVGAPDPTWGELPRMRAGQGPALPPARAALRQQHRTLATR
jgi:acyl-CoA synthetase (AMP-forming)/AMP-acid ligase II